MNWFRRLFWFMKPATMQLSTESLQYWMTRYDRERKK